MPKDVHCSLMYKKGKLEVFRGPAIREQKVSSDGILCSH